LEPIGPEAISSTPPARFPVRTALGFYALLGLSAWLVRSLGQGESLFFANPEAAREGIRLTADVSLGLATGALAIAASHALTRFTRAGERLSRALGALLGPLELRHCVALAVASGVGEEAFFRGLLQPNFGLIVASTAFGLVHFVPRRELWPWTLFALAGGFALGGLFEASGNLVAPIVAHATLNAVNLRMLAREFDASRA
jgi:membrane protease YdiL (CAAX protease family)